MEPFPEVMGQCRVNFLKSGGRGLGIISVTALEDHGGEGEL